MFIIGNKTEVTFWYICWGPGKGNYDLEIYKTPYGIRRWLLNPTFSELPVCRIGLMSITEKGPVELKHWNTREEFLTSRGQDER